MNRFTQAERQSLLQFLQTGKRSAINASRIAAHMHFPIGGNQVKTRNLIRECIELEGDLIASSLSNPKGFYIVDINNLTEFESYLDSLENRAAEIINRRNHLIRNWNTVVVQNQTQRAILTIA
jgi:hypothetical protein